MFSCHLTSVIRDVNKASISLTLAKQSSQTNKKIMFRKVVSRSLCLKKILGMCCSPANSVLASSGLRLLNGKNIVGFSFYARSCPSRSNIWYGMAGWPFPEDEAGTNHRNEGAKYSTVGGPSEAHPGTLAHTCNRWDLPGMMSTIEFQNFLKDVGEVEKSYDRLKVKSIIIWLWWLSVNILKSAW